MEVLSVLRKKGLDMKITELNNCLLKMRECYDFNDDETDIRIGDLAECINGRTVEIYTVDKNGTQVALRKRVDE